MVFYTSQPFIGLKISPLSNYTYFSLDLIRGRKDALKCISWRVKGVINVTVSGVLEIDVPHWQIKSAALA